jgi:hypothetical protein
MAVLTLMNNGEFQSTKMEYMSIFYISGSNAEEEGLFTGPPESNIGQGTMLLLDVNGYTLTEIVRDISEYSPFKFYFKVLHAKPGVVFITIVCKILDDFGQIISDTTFENVRFDVKPSIFYLKNNTKIRHYIETLEEGKYNFQLSVFTKKPNSLGGSGFEYSPIGTFNLKRFPIFNEALNIYEAEFEVCELLKSIFKFDVGSKIIESDAYYNPDGLENMGAMQFIYGGFVLYFNYGITSPIYNEVWLSPMCMAVYGGISPYTNKLIFPEFRTNDLLLLDSFCQGDGLPYIERPLLTYKRDASSQKIIKANRFIAIPVLNSYIPDDVITYSIQPYQINYFADGIKQYQIYDGVVSLPLVSPFIDISTGFNAIDFSCILLNYKYIMYQFQALFGFPIGECAFNVNFTSSKGSSGGVIGNFSLTNNLSGKVFIYLDDLGMPQTAYFNEIYEVEQVVKNKVVENTNDTSITGTDRLFVLDTDVKRTFTLRSEAMDKDEVLRYQQILHSPAVHEIIDSMKPFNPNWLEQSQWANQSFKRVIVLDSKTVIGKGIDPLFTFELTFQYADNDYLTAYNS